MLGLNKKIANIVMQILDSTLGKKFPIIDKATVIFQAQDNKIKDLERRVDALESYLKENK